MLLMLYLDLPFLLASSLIRLYYAILTNLWSSIVKPISNMHNSIFNIFHSLFNFFWFHDQCTEQSINTLSSNMLCPKTVEILAVKGLKEDILAGT